MFLSKRSKFLTVISSMLILTCTHASQENDSYVLSTGKQGAKALDIQQGFLKKDTLEHLKNAGLSEGQVVWDIGCGNGSMTEYLAKKVGKKGHVYAVDISSEMIERAKKRIKASGLTNVTFILGDLNSIKLPINNANIVYSRFIFMHLKNPKTIMKKIYNLLKVGGIFTLQESTLKDVNASQDLESFKEYREATILLGESKGLDYNIGEKLDGICSAIGFKVLSSHSKMYKLTSSTASSLMKIRLSEIGPKLLEAKISTQAQIDKWKKTSQNLEKLPADSAFFMVPGRLHFVIARKRRES